MTALEHVHVRRNRQLQVEQTPGLGRVRLEEPVVGVEVGVVEVVAAHLVLVLTEHLAVRDARRVDDVLEVGHALKVHQDAFEAVRDLHRHRIQGDTAHLLEVGELGDLHAVQPDLPAQPPGAERG